MAMDFPNYSYNQRAKIIMLKGEKGEPGTAEVGEGEITSRELASNSVIEAKIADGAVTTAKIADGAITETKLGFVLPPDSCIYLKKPQASTYTFTDTLQSRIGLQSYYTKGDAFSYNDNNGVLMLKDATAQICLTLQTNSATTDSGVYGLIMKNDEEIAAVFGKTSGGFLNLSYDAILSFEQNDVITAEIRVETAGSYGLYHTTGLTLKEV